MLACQAGIILVGECSVFSSQTLRLPSFILIVAEGWGEKNLYRGDGLALSLPPLSSLTPNQTWSVR